MRLKQHIFELVVANTPLVALDLIVMSSRGRVLVGKRTNRPAQNCWFVPGGRVRKDEPLDAAFRRLLDEELGACAQGCKGLFDGAYQHLYDDASFSESVSTHYVVLAYRVQLEGEPIEFPNAQHSEYLWLSPAEIVAHQQVHANTKAYFASERMALDHLGGASTSA